MDRAGDPGLRECLDTFGAVPVEGPKRCGKTTSAARPAASELGIAGPRNNHQNRRPAKLDVSAAPEEERPPSAGLVVVGPGTVAQARPDGVAVAPVDRLGAQPQARAPSDATGCPRTRPVASGRVAAPPARKGCPSRRPRHPPFESLATRPSDAGARRRGGGRAPPGGTFGFSRVKMSDFLE